MSEIKPLLNIVSDLRSLADNLQAVVDAMVGNEPAEVTQEETAAPELKAEAKPVTLEQVRAVLAEKSQDGFTDKVRGLLEKHGAMKLSQIDPSEFSTLLAEAEALK